MQFPKYILLKNNEFFNESIFLFLMIISHNSNKSSIRVNLQIYKIIHFFGIF